MADLPERSRIQRIANTMTIAFFIAALVLTFPVLGLIAYSCGWLSGPGR